MAGFWLESFSECQTVVFLLYPHMVGKVGEALRVPFIRALILFIEAPLSWSIHPKTSTPNTITLSVRVSTY